MLFYLTLQISVIKKKGPAKNFFASMQKAKLIQSHNIFNRPSGDIPHLCFHRKQGKELVPGPLVRPLLFQPLPSYEVYAQSPRAPPIVADEELESDHCQLK